MGALSIRAYCVFPLLSYYLGFSQSSALYIYMNCAKLLENSNNEHTKIQSNWHLPDRREGRKCATSSVLELLLCPKSKGLFTKWSLQHISSCCLVGFKGQPDACCLFLSFHFSLLPLHCNVFFHSFLLPSAMSLVFFVFTAA